ncbi:hypothetical protein [Flavobacterium aciduliphilum]|uniref:Uncharacterized protein n=1 Tax=Flavobacterium aciduliphilum TaxID=1101402 RepID=A0A328YAL2_9FLAO|nr:hypothetical protein [Flavobacterium aciduliphilum]RAR70630.1 hypothetical protein CLV55_11030 [Flavobacterium aciduliphilum]
MKKIILILFLTLTESMLANVNCDTITNWRVFKDDKLIWESNGLESYRNTIDISIAENFSNINFDIFYDFNREILERKVELVCEEKVIATLSDKNYCYEKFVIPKTNFTKNTKYLNKKIFIKYFDKINPNGIIVGVIKIIK